MTTTNKADRGVRTVKVSEERMALLALNDTVWKPNVATFRQKRKLHMGPQRHVCVQLVVEIIIIIIICLFFALLLLLSRQHPVTYRGGSEKDIYLHDKKAICGL